MDIDVDLRNKALKANTLYVIRTQSSHHIKYIKKYVYLTYVLSHLCLNHRQNGGYKIK